MPQTVGSLSSALNLTYINLLIDVATGLRDASREDPQASPAQDAFGETGMMHDQTWCEDADFIAVSWMHGL